jgi:hypothetical protein
MRAVPWSAPHSDILADRDPADIRTDILAKLPKPVESTVNSALFRELRTAGEHKVNFAQIEVPTRVARAAFA